MEVHFLRSFLKDIEKIRTKKDKELISKAIEKAEQAKSLDSIAGIKKLSGHTGF